MTRRVPLTVAAAFAAAPALAQTSAPLPAMAEAALPHDLTPWGMFMAADIVVKAVMIGLAAASVATWTVWLVKTVELLLSSRRIRRQQRLLAAAECLEEATAAGPMRSGPGALMVRLAAAEIRASQGLERSGIKERVAARLERTVLRAGRRAGVGTGILATIGSTAPFVGLFGTVWGIMNAFVGISEAQTTNLAVVAPGIAEALLATAIGLIAAIPAVVIYNVFARWIGGYRAGLADIAAEIQRLVSRDLDRAAHRRFEPAE